MLLGRVAGAVPEGPGTPVPIRAFALAAAAASISPAPCWLTDCSPFKTMLPSARRRFVAVFISAARIIEGVQEGFFCLTSAATPAVIGELIEVPEAEMKPV